ncbi:MAG TPA: hypothetical protein VK766_03530 [Cytophagaceae bacterium]|jgi:hypothetical protein|nr:hypothetical protein [Cytophagaceae bacterium]
MKKMTILLKEINELTLKMEQEYPELYQYLDENPLTIPKTSHSHLDTKVFSEYLESLKIILKDYIESHKRQ